MTDETKEKITKELQHKINVLNVQKEKLEQTFGDFQIQVNRLREKKNELRKKAASGNYKDIKNYNEFIQKYIDFSEIVDLERKKIEGAVQTLCEQDFVKNSELRGFIQAMVLNKIAPQNSGGGQTKRPGRFSINHL